MKTAYPAIIHAEDGSFWVEFPDLEGCFSDGDTLPDAISNAADALGGYLCSLMDRQIDIPKVSNSQEINGDGGIVTIIVTDPLKYKKSTRSVKKTLTIPEWLNEEAEKNILIFHRFYNKLLSH
ncbi:MAG: type II toxin-antitoxin system HicB family antitoxin [Clostridia bacterium]|nr:type II toxin-antitoxin system HicB family antitoxin [Clostridia bacterium]